jgi:hypothetical protein
LETKIKGGYPLSSPRGHLATDHFLIDWDRKRDFENNKITISGFVKGNPHRDILDKNKLARLKALKLVVLFLNSSRKVVDYKDLDFTFEPGKEPNILDPVEFKTETSLNTDFVFITFRYKVVYMEGRFDSNLI